MRANSSLRILEISRKAIKNNCVANLSGLGLQHIEIQRITFFGFFQLFLYLTVWLAEDCHSAPNAPKRHLCVSHDQNLHILGVKNAKHCKNVKKCFLLQKPPKMAKSHFRVSNDQNFRLWGSKMQKNCKKFSNFFLAPKVIWVQFAQKLGKKIKKSSTNLFCPKWGNDNN